MSLAGGWRAEVVVVCGLKASRFHGVDMHLRDASQGRACIAMPNRWLASQPRLQTFGAGAQMTCGVRPRWPGTVGNATAGMRGRVGMWSNAGVFVRVWEFEVPGDHTAAFVEAYAADGAWAELSGKAARFSGTGLYRDTARVSRFLTIDRWQDERDWRSFLNAFGRAYEVLDAQLERLANGGRSLFEGSS